MIDSPELDLNISTDNKSLNNMKGLLCKLSKQRRWKILRLGSTNDGGCISIHMHSGEGADWGHVPLKKNVQIMYSEIVSGVIINTTIYM